MTNKKKTLAKTLAKKTGMSHQAAVNILNGNGPDRGVLPDVDPEHRQADMLAGKVRWGCWRYRPDNLTIEDVRNGYYIKLEDCGSSAQILDWIAQVSSKISLYTSEDVGNLVRAIDELLDMQAHFCSFGRDMRDDPKRIIDALCAGLEPLTLDRLRDRLR